MSKEIWVIDKHTSFRKGLKVLLQKKYPTYQVISFASFKQIPSFEPEKPILVLIEPFLQNHLKKQIDVFHSKQIPTAFITMEQRKQQLLQFINMDSLGYLRKDMTTEDLLIALDSLLQGDRYLHPSFGATLIEYINKET